MNYNYNNYNNNSNNNNNYNNNSYNNNYYYNYTTQQLQPHNNYSYNYNNNNYNHTTTTATTTTTTTATTIWLQLHYTNYITPQLQLHYATTTVAVHHTTSSSCGWGDHCNHCNHSSKHNSNHLSVNQWLRSAIRDSQQPTSPIGFLFWNFRHRLMRYYW